MAELKMGFFLLNKKLKKNVKQGRSWFFFRVFYGGRAV